MQNERTTKTTKSFTNVKYYFESRRTQDPEGERDGAPKNENNALSFASPIVRFV